MQASQEIETKPPSEERLPVLDLIRGVAILMILPANLPFFSHPYPPSPIQAESGLADRLVIALTVFLVYGKFITLLSILFGAGLAIQADKAQATGRPFRRYYTRRMVVLLIIGLAHALMFWWGDILTLYAIVGLLTLLLCQLGKRALLWVAGSLLTWGYVWLLLFTLVVAIFDEEKLTRPQARPSGAVTEPSKDGTTKAPTMKQQAPTQLKAPAKSEAERAEQIGKAIEQYFSSENQIRIYRHGTFGERVRNNAIFLSLFMCCFFWLIGAYVLACFLFGVYLLRSGFFHDVNANRPLLFKFIGYGLTIGIPFHAAAVFAYWRNPNGIFSWLFVSFGAFAFAIAYLGLLTLWSQGKHAEWLQSRLRAVGRLALSNYLFQSIVCTFIFYGHGLGLFGQLSHGVVFSLVPTLWLFHLLISPLWLGHFHIGPFEWLWRSLAEGRRRPFLRRV